MFIQSIDSFTPSFNAKIGPFLAQEIEKRREYILANYKACNIEPGLKELKESIKKIEKLLPEIDNSSTIVEVKFKKKKRIKNDRLIKKLTPYYEITNEKGSFEYNTDRGDDSYYRFFKYNKLISILENLSEKLAPWMK